MKRNKVIYLIALLVSGLFASCEKETEDISRVTFFPTFEMTGDQYQSLVVGETYTEQGVIATEEGAEIPVTTTGTVDTSTPGVYTITYSAVNKDNFSGSTTRVIAVLPEPEQEGVNIAGSYQNIGNFTYTAKVEKLAPGFYVSSNVWGGNSAAIIPAYIFTTDGTNLTLPTSNISPYGRVEGTGTLNASGLMVLSVTLLDQGPLTQTKQWQRVQ